MGYLRSLSFLASFNCISTTTLSNSMNIQSAITRLIRWTLDYRTKNEGFYHVFQPRFWHRLLKSRSVLWECYGGSFWPERITVSIFTQCLVLAARYGSLCSNLEMKDPENFAKGLFYYWGVEICLFSSEIVSEYGKTDRNEAIEA